MILDISKKLNTTYNLQTAFGPNPKNSTQCCLEKTGKSTNDTTKDTSQNGSGNSANDTLKAVAVGASLAIGCVVVGAEITKAAYRVGSENKPKDNVHDGRFQLYKLVRWDDIDSADPVHTGIQRAATAGSSSGDRQGGSLEERLREMESKLKMLNGGVHS